MDTPKVDSNLPKVKGKKAITLDAEKKWLASKEQSLSFFQSSAAVPAQNGGQSTYKSGSSIFEGKSQSIVDTKCKNADDTKSLAKASEEVYTAGLKKAKDPATIQMSELRKRASDLNITLDVHDNNPANYNNLKARVEAKEKEKAAQQPALPPKAKAPVVL